MACKDTSKLPNKPSIIVFDLDYTLWPFWIDTHVNPPFRLHNQTVLDCSNNKIEPYQDVPEILSSLSKTYKLGVASRTGAIDEAKQLMGLFDWVKYFDKNCIEIFPGDKKTHFRNIHKATGIPFKEMIFFDDEYRNITSVGSLGVKCIFIKDGMTFKELKKGLDSFQTEKY